MNQLIQEIKDLYKNPRLCIQYLVLNFFLISMGVAAVVYTKKEIAVEASKVQSEQILNVGQQLKKVDLPRKTEKDLQHLQQNAEQTLSEIQKNSPKK